MNIKESGLWSFLIYPWLNCSSSNSPAATVRAASFWIWFPVFSPSNFLSCTTHRVFYFSTLSNYKTVFPDLLHFILKTDIAAFIIYKMLGVYFNFGLITFSICFGWVYCLV